MAGLIYSFLAAFCLFFANTLFAFGPVSKMAHMTYEEFGNTVRVSLQMNYMDALAFAELKQPARSQEEFRSRQLPQIFQATIGRSPIMMNGRACTWTTPGGVFGKNAMQIQVVATCPEYSQNLNWDLGYLKQFPDDYFIALEAVFSDNEKLGDMITPKNPYFRRDSKVFSTHAIAGLTFLATQASGWIFILLILILVNSSRGQAEASVWVGFATACMVLAFVANLSFADRLPLDLVAGGLGIIICMSTVSLFRRPGKDIRWQWTVLTILGTSYGMVARLDFNGATKVNTVLAGFGFMIPIVACAVLMLLILLPWKPRIASRKVRLSLSGALGLAMLLVLSS